VECRFVFIPNLSSGFPTEAKILCAWPNELMQICLRPTHRGLPSALEIAERNFPRQQDPSPIRWPNSEKGHFDPDTNDEIPNDEQIVARLMSESRRFEILRDPFHFAFVEEFRVTTPLQAH